MIHLVLYVNIRLKSKSHIATINLQNNYTALSFSTDYYETVILL